VIVKNGHGDGHVSSMTTSFERGLSKLKLSVVMEVVTGFVVIRDQQGLTFSEQGDCPGQHRSKTITDSNRETRPSPAPQERLHPDRNLSSISSATNQAFPSLAREFGPDQSKRIPPPIF
jgi:hypothetical protein